MKRRFIIVSLLAATLLSCSQLQDREPQIEVLAHRGACFLAPENTWPAIESALQHGADWIEIDVRQSADSVLFNFHDISVERTTNGEGEISELTSEHILKLDAGSWFSEDYKGVGVPTVESLLDSLKGRAKVFFDVKRGTSVEKLVSMVEQKGFEEDCFFWFGDPSSVEVLTQIAPQMQIKVNAKSVEMLKEWQKVCNPSIIEVSTDNLGDELEAYCKESGIRIMIAVSDDTPENYLRALEKRPDIINIDAPELWQEVLEKR